MSGTTVNKIWRRSLAAIVGGLGMCGVFGSCAQPPPPAVSDAAIVYIDTKTQETRLLPRQAQTPAINPQTGERTLVPGLYCKTCAKWYPSPPPEVLQRSTAAYRCPKDGQPMSLEGPPQ